MSPSKPRPDQALEILRSTLSKEHLDLINRIWKHFRAKHQWPIAWVLHSPDRKQAIRSAVQQLGTTIVQETNVPQHGSTYQLTLLGMLLTDDGPRLETLLEQYLQFIRTRYQTEPENRTVESSQIQEKLQLDPEWTHLLGQAILAGSLWNGGFGGGAGNWHAGILNAVEDFPPDGSLLNELHLLVLGGQSSEAPARLPDPAQAYPQTQQQSPSESPHQPIDPLRRRYQVFLSSTYEDLKEERQHAMQALLETKCIPTGMELFPAASEDQWNLIKRVIDDCDYYIVIVAGRYGSIAPGGRSYTEMEFDYASTRRKSVLGFYHASPGTLPGNKLESTDEGRDHLTAFTQKIKNKPCKPWSTPDGLGSAIKSAILHAIEHDPKPGWIRADTDLGLSAVPQLQQSPPLSKQAQMLLREVAASAQGVLLRITSPSRIRLQTNAKIVVDETAPRARAEWDDVIAELKRRGLISDPTGENKVFRITKAGYEAADSMVPD